jgi:hypothetical protein
LTRNDDNEDLRTDVLIGLSTINPQEHGVNFDEGRKGPLHGDEGGLLLKMLAEPNEEYVDELMIVD